MKTDNKTQRGAIKKLALSLFLPIFIALISTAFPQAVHAGRYELVKGKGIEVCEAYNKYLATQTTPQTCDRKIPPQFPELKNPDWQPLNIKDNKLLVLRIENYLQIPLDEKATRPWKPVHREEDLQTFQTSEHLRLATTEVDIDNDGTKETVARYRSFHCQTWDLPDKAPAWKAPLVVLNASQQAVDVEKTYPLAQNREKRYVSNADQIQTLKTVEERLHFIRHKLEFKESKYAAGLSELQGYDLFIFGNVTYFDKWDELRSRDSYQCLTVYKTEIGKTQEMCRYQFHW